MDSIDLEGVKQLLIAAADRVIGHRDALTKADQAIGDGDHGVAMERGFSAARQAVTTKPAQTVGDVFKNAGLAVLAQSGGASGAVFGTFFIGAGKPLSYPSLDVSGYTAALVAGLDAVQARGKAKPGDKTMVDALAAAIAAVTNTPHGQDLCTVAGVAAAGARAGSYATKDGSIHWQGQDIRRAQPRPCGSWFDYALPGTGGMGGDVKQHVSPIA